MTDSAAPYHAHIYFDSDTFPVAQELHQHLNDMRTNDALPGLVLVGKMHEHGVGPHPKPQYEVQFLASTLPAMVRLIEEAGLTALVHPLTDDDLADHTTLAEWIGSPLPLDLSVMDPPGRNKGVARFGKVDF